MTDTRAGRSGDRRLLAAISLVASLCLAEVAFDHGPVASGRKAIPGAPSVAPGQVRDVDAEQIRRLILERRLSDREADHYRVLESTEQPAAASAAPDR